MISNNVNAAFGGSAGLTQDYYEALVTSAMIPTRAAIERAKDREDELEVRKAVFDDLDTKLGNLRTSLLALRQTEEESVFDDKKVTSSDESFATGSATSGAVDASYEVHIDSLAQTHRVWSDQQDDTWGISLGGNGKTGEFRIRSGSDSANDINVVLDHGATLSEIRDAINDAVQAELDAETLTEEFAVHASIVDDRLVIEPENGGNDYALEVADISRNPLRKLNIRKGSGDPDVDGNGINDNNEINAEDAQFSVNGISVTRSSNTGIDDVIEGVTLNLKKAHGSGNSDVMEITVSPDVDATSKSVSSFVTNLNSFTSWMAAKSGVTEGADGTYTRGALASDFGLRGLRRSLIQTTFATWSDAPSGTQYDRLDQVGLELGDDLVAKVDSADLEAALEADYDGVVALFEGIMSKVQTILDPYTDGSDDQVDRMKTSAQNALDTQAARIERMEAAEARREELVRNQIAYQFAAISSYNDQGRFLVSTMFSAFG